MRRERRSKSPAERLRSSVAKLTARGRSCCGWLSEGVLRSDSLNAEQRWHDNGAACVLAGATGRHPAGVTGMRSPRGAACLTRSDAYARAWKNEGSARGGLGRGKGTGAGRIAGPASAGGPEVRRWPVKRETIFQILFSMNFQISVFKYHFEQENDFF